ncbi:MAG TPA: CAP domain-containing protein [Nannocystaceae bacterium]|nr:CAP domain-containing protein [Nannocystaceae bacterium]
MRPRGVVGIAVALCWTAGCYSGTTQPVPWMGDDDATQDGTDAGDDGNDDANDAADDGGDDGADSADGADGADDSADGADGADDAADDAGTDGGASADGAGTEGGSLDDGGTTGGADDGGDGGASEVPDNDYCMEYADWDPGWSQLEQQILDIVNQRRSEGANCGSAGNFAPAGPLTMNPALRCAARKQSKQMVENDFFDHTTPWGEGPGDRIAGAGYNGFTWGENIAAGNSTAAATMDQWMNSDGHCGNIMNPDFEDIGVGYYPGGGYGHYWTQTFGAGG